MLRKFSPLWKASSTNLEVRARAFPSLPTLPFDSDERPAPNPSPRSRLGKGVLVRPFPLNTQGNRSPDASRLSMRLRIAQRRLPGILILIALLFSEFGSSAQSNARGGNLLVSVPLSDGDPKDSNHAPDSPQRKPLPGEDPEGSGEADDLDHRFQTNVLAIFPSHLSCSLHLSEHRGFLPARRRFLEFCKLKLDC